MNSRASEFGASDDDHEDFLLAAVGQLNWSSSSVEYWVSAEVSDVVEVWILFRSSHDFTSHAELCT